MKLLMYCDGPISIRYHRTLPLKQSSAHAQQARNGNNVITVLNICK